MKKLLLSGAMLMALSFSVKAQEIYAEDFDGLTVGNVGTDLTGATAGQGGIFTQAVANATPADFQIVADGFSGNALQITGASVAAGTTNATDNARYAWTNALAGAWDAREDGNDLITAEFYINSATVAGSTNVLRAVVYDASYRVLGGVSYNAATGVLSGNIYYSQNNQAGTYNIRLTDDPAGLVIPENTWIRIGMAIEPASGTAIWVLPQFSMTDPDTGDQVALQAGFTSTFAAGFVPAEFDYEVFTGNANNTASATIKYDAVNISYAADLSNWLSVDEIKTPANVLAVFPNPATNVVNVANAGAINSIAIADLNGRTVKSANFASVSEAQVNISDLASGVYMMTVSSDKGVSTKKIVKN